MQSKNRGRADVPASASYAAVDQETSASVTGWRRARGTVGPVVMRCMYLVALAMNARCTPPMPSDAGESDGIPAGLYVGESACEIIQTLTTSDGGVETGVTPAGDAVPITRNFGVDGIELTAQGTPVGMGDGVESVTGPMVITTTIRSVSKGENRLVLISNVMITYTDSITGTIQLTGSETVIYTFQPPNTVLMDATMLAISPTQAGRGLIVQSDCNAQMTR